MSPHYTFEQALQVLEIDASAGPRNAKRALMLQLQRHGPEPSPEDYARFTGAYEVLKSPEAWPDYKAPETYNDDPLPKTEKRLPPGHKRSQRERPASAAQSAPAAHAWSEAPDAKPSARPSARPSADNPFLTADLPDVEGKGAHADTGTSALLADEAVTAALHRLEKNYGALLARDTLVPHMAPNRSDELTGFLVRLLEQGHILATGAAVGALLELMSGETSYEFLKSRGVVTLLLGVFVRCDKDVKAITVGASIQRAYDRWATASELNPPSLDISTRDSLRITRSLAALPEEFPPPLLAATARAAQRGDLSAARSDFAAWIDSYSEQADGLRRILARSAPALLHAMQDLFPDRDGEEALARAKLQRRKKLGMRAAVVVLLIAGAWFITQDDAFETAARKELLDAGRDLCDFAGAEHASCLLGKVVLDALPSGDCTIIEPAIPKFVASVRSMKNNTGGMSSAVDLGAVNALKGKADKIVIAAQSKCAGI
jgi:hypothetical protein